MCLEKNAQADLNLRWAYKSEGMFTDYRNASTVCIIKEIFVAYCNKYFGQITLLTNHLELFQFGCKVPY